MAYDNVNPVGMTFPEYMNGTTAKNNPVGMTPSPGDENPQKCIIRRPVGVLPMAVFDPVDFIDNFDGMKNHHNIFVFRLIF